MNEWVLAAAKEAGKKDQERNHRDGDGSDGGETGGGSTPEPDRPQDQEKSTTVYTALDIEMMNRGKLLLDAICTPTDIAYPTDLTLLNDAREKLELVIDYLNEPDQGRQKKPRTYRKKARREYLAVDKQRRKSAKTWRKAVGRQLRYVERDLRILELYWDRLRLLLSGCIDSCWSFKNCTVSKKEMYEKKSHQIEDRIVSISQPHIRPIVRGKVRTNVEFGAKIAISVVNGDVRIERLSWDNFNEGLTLQEAIERYRERYGVYPEAVLADKIYRNRENLQYVGNSTFG